MLVLGFAVMVLGMGQGAYSSIVIDQIRTATNIAMPTVFLTFCVSAVAALVALTTPSPLPRQVARGALALETLAVVVFFLAVKLIAY